jgi:hypothetical protein
MITSLEILTADTNIPQELALVTTQIQSLYNARKSKYDNMEPSSGEYYSAYKDFQVIGNIKYFHETYLSMIIPNDKIKDNWKLLYDNIKTDLETVNIEITSLESQLTQSMSSSGNSSSDIQTLIIEKSEQKKALESACIYVEYLKRFMGCYFETMPIYGIGDIINFVDARKFQIKAIIRKNDFKDIEGINAIYPNIYSAQLPSDISNIKFYYGELTTTTSTKSPYILWDSIIELLTQMSIILI